MTIDKSEFLEQALNFWFNDQVHIRSPFPKYIHNQLKIDATEKFEKWLTNLNLDAKDEINDEIIAEKFEEFLFETGHDLVLTEDEKITILYPFLPRTDDKIINDKNEDATITSRFIIKEGDHKFLELSCKTLNNNENWKTRFELP